jgi:heat shock protein HtpX
MTIYSQIASNKRRSILLLFFFIVIILLLGWVLGEALNAGYSGLMITVPAAFFMGLFSYFSGDKVALWTAGAQEIKKEDNPYVFRMVENLCITAGLPMPKIYIIQDPAPNAFATGRDPKHASIALTTGIIERLENEELEGVIAHELSHVKNYDIRLMTIVIICVGITMLLADWLLRARFFGGNRGKGGQIAGIFFIVGLILAIFSPIIARLIQFAVSRKREFLADASGSLLTRYPEGLAKALEKISQYDRPVARASNATAHLYISNPFGAKTARGFAKFFSTHPPVEERVAALRKMGGQT